MMRYQRVSPDCAPLAGNGKRPNGGTIHQTQPSTTTTPTNPNIASNPIASSSSSFEPNKALRFRSPSRTPERNNNHFESNEGSPSDMLLQWGHRKRPRASRTEIRAPLTDDSSSSSSAQAKHSLKPHRRLVGPIVASMPPPPPATPLSSNGRARKEVSGSLLNRTLEDRAVTATGSSPARIPGGGNARNASRSTAGKRSPPPEKSERKISSSARTAQNEKLNGSSPDGISHVDSPALTQHRDHEAHNFNVSGWGASKDDKAASVETLLEWPKVVIPLSRKEKEEDFFAMKGSKLPQRPKKRPKNVERALQYVFPGTWLIDVTRSRYEVREKKCVKKQQKRRGLKGMESVESDSE